MCTLNNLKKFLKLHRRILGLSLPMILSCLAGVVMSLFWFKTRNNLFFKLSLAFIIVWCLFGVRFLYLWMFTKRLGVKNVNRSFETFLNGFPVWAYESNAVFFRLGKFLGHGLCYPASALLMLIWQDYPKTRYVFGESYNPTTREWGDHCWMELKAYGIWWAIDSTWRYPVCPVPRWWHKLEFLAKDVRKISHDEFFSHQIANQIAEGIKNPKTSYFFHELALFSKSTGSRDRMVLEVYDIEKIDNTGSRVNPLIIGIYDTEKPITQKIIRQFILKDTRLLPKRRSFRRARAIDKLIRKKLDLASSS